MLQTGLDRRGKLKLKEAIHMRTKGDEFFNFIDIISRIFRTMFRDRKNAAQFHGSKYPSFQRRKSTAH